MMRRVITRPVISTWGARVRGLVGNKGQQAVVDLAHSLQKVTTEVPSAASHHASPETIMKEFQMPNRHRYLGI